MDVSELLRFICANDTIFIRISYTSTHTHRTQFFYVHPIIIRMVAWGEFPISNRLIFSMGFHIKINRPNLSERISGFQSFSILKLYKFAVHTQRKKREKAQRNCKSCERLSLAKFIFNVKWIIEWSLNASKTQWNSWNEIRQMRRAHAVKCTHTQTHNGSF